MTPELRAYYRRIGARGGQAGKGTRVRIELMRANANKRWAKYRIAQASAKAKAKQAAKKPVPKKASPKFVAVPSIQSQPVIGFK